MTHYDARQDANTGLWHYTSLRGGRAHAVGGCADDGGHETREQACACYRGWLVETAKFGTMASLGGTCAVPGCGHGSDAMATTAHGLCFFFCDEHMNVDGLDSVFPPVGSIITG